MLAYLGPTVAGLFPAVSISEENCVVPGPGMRRVLMSILRYSHELS